MADTGQVAIAMNWGEMASNMAHLPHSKVERWEERPRVGADRLLALAAAPAFAIMALVMGIQGNGMPEMLCSAAGDASLLTGMVPMYLLMSAFHLAPWLRLITKWR